MKRKEFNELRAKEMKALRKLANEKKLEASKKRMEIVGGKEKNLKATNNLRHDLAQILTIIREKEIIEKLASVKKGETDRRGTVGSSSEKQK